MRVTCKLLKRYLKGVFEVTELERRALSGDTEAQRECTEKGILLPCSFCGGNAI